MIFTFYNKYLILEVFGGNEPHWTVLRAYLRFCTQRITSGWLRGAYMVLGMEPRTQLSRQNALFCVLSLWPPSILLNEEQISICMLYFHCNNYLLNCIFETIDTHVLFWFPKMYHWNSSFTDPLTSNILKKGFPLIEYNICF